MSGLISRRQIFPAAAAFGAGAYFGLDRLAKADTYPARDINFIIPYGPGGSFDAYGRKFSVLLQSALGHVNVAPINAPGAAGKQAIFQLLQDAPDGYNISLVAIPGILMTEGGGPIDLGKLTWVANLGRDSYGLGVGKDGGIKNVADLKALSAKRPVVFATTGVGSTDYFAAKVFAASLDIKIRFVSGYADSSTSAIAVTRGDVDAVVHSLSTLRQMQSSGLARVIFAFQEKSDIPGIQDATALGKPDLGKIYQWRPVAAPPSVPRDIVMKLSGALVAAAKTPDAAAWAAKLDTTLYPLNADQTVQMIREQRALIAKWHSVL